MPLSVQCSSLSLGAGLRLTGSLLLRRRRMLAGSKPLQIWEKEVRNGHIKRITDNDIQSSVLEIMSTNISTTFVSCPADSSKTLGIKLPFLVMIIKNVRAAHRRARARRATLATPRPTRARTLCLSLSVCLSLGSPSR